MARIRLPSRPRRKSAGRKNRSTRKRPSDVRPSRPPTTFLVAGSLTRTASARLSECPACASLYARNPSVITASSASSGASVKVIAVSASSATACPPQMKHGHSLIFRPRLGRALRHPVVALIRGLEAQVGKAQVIVRPPPQRPMVFPVGFIDRQIVDRSETPLHHAGRIEFPVLVSVRAEPIAAVVMPFISKPHGDAIVVEGPEFFDQPVIELLVPFACEKGDDFGPPVDEFRAVSPPAILGISQSNPLRVPAVPAVFRRPDLGDRGLACEGREGRGH